MSKEWQYPIAKEIKLLNRLEELNRLNEQLEEIGDEAGWPPRAVFDLSLVCEELIVNIVNYGYPQGEEHFIRVLINASAEGVEVKIEDGGVPFNPLEETEPDIELELEDREIGGLGIFFVRKVMDDIRYERDGNVNRVRMSKTFAYAHKQDEE